MRTRRPRAGEDECGVDTFDRPRVAAGGAVLGRRTGLVAFGAQALEHGADLKEAHFALAVALVVTEGAQQPGQQAVAHHAEVLTERVLDGDARKAAPVGVKRTELPRRQEREVHRFIKTATDERIARAIDR